MQLISTLSKQKLVITLTISFVIAVLILLVTTIPASAHTKEDGASIKYYTSIQIAEGDTLWTIAEQYTNGSVKETQNYISDICELNHLTSEDSIHSGQNLTIYYYSDELK